MLKKILKAYDYPVFFTVIVLCLFGLIMVYSSSMITAVARWGLADDHFYQRQKIAFVISFAAMLLTMFFPYQLYKHPRFLLAMMGGTCGLLLLVFLAGHTAGNAQSWLALGGFNLQPAEAAKLAVIIYLSAIYSKRQDRINNIDKAVMPTMIFLSTICFFIAIQPDYGNVIIILLIAGTILISSGMSLKSLSKLVGIFGAAIALIGLLVVISGNFSTVVSEERVSRFTGLKEPFKTEDDEGYHLANSLLAIGSGGVKGLGLGQSIQKYGYLPESHTDFIISIIAEELGFFGVAIVIGGLGFIVLRGFLLAARCKDAFGSLLLIGISSMIGIQVLINLGGATGLLPITGITLPFISYGGSSLILLMASIGIYQNVIMKMNLKSKQEEVK
ncbi:FtsW/RodA/SpoVE family cell cycle protein [Peribacillus deserti]|uniref:Probable peptidoglycan glycosyltransferase FtsW n=1 Tax=Peribacillus deserti TaxID=673318 RepID=A0A2N5MA89_9BACI|nr:FtsW/RodA/SpoVE family cell cycle protein [Peribacillus deserti]PLT31274.1 cell division protein FtsW [Peribacillus deserti]